MPDNRFNRIRSNLERGRLVCGIEMKTRSTEIVETAGAVGLDYVWIDLEHSGPSPYDGPALEAYQRAAEVSGTSLLVRPPSGEPAVVRKVLDTGVRTLLLPRIETAEEVRTAVRAARFSYEGEPGDRGVGTARGSRWGRDLTDHARREDETVLVGAMIENETAVENLVDILSVPELGFVFVGAADLSVSLGVPLETNRPVVRDQVDEIVAVSRENEVPVGLIATEREQIRSAIDDGVSLIRVGTDIGAVQDTFEGVLDELP